MTNFRGIEEDAESLRRSGSLDFTKGLRVGGLKVFARKVGGYLRLYQQDRDGVLTDLTGGVVGGVDHAVLANLPYSDSGHTGFAPSHGHTHSLSSSTHTPTTLDAFNTRISDATLDDSGDSRPPTTHTHTGAGPHTVESHSDTDATGTQLNTLIDGSEIDTLHTHRGTFYIPIAGSLGTDLNDGILFQVD